MPESVNQPVENLTIEEKAMLTVGQDSWSTMPIESARIPSLHLCDGPHGVRFMSGQTVEVNVSTKTTCFPTASAMASAWNPELAREVGEAIGDEARALGVHILLGPGINIKRSPLGGRNFEYYSEDPVLTAKMAAAFVEGLQSKGVGACLKHFACNNQEFQRMTIDTIVDERTMREVYLYAFEKVVKQSRPYSLMCAYNAVNGVLCSENKVLLTDILKKEWGFEGIIMSDWSAVNNRTRSLNAGLDLEMPGGNKAAMKEFIKDCKWKKADRDALNESAFRMVRIARRSEKEFSGLPSFDQDIHHKLARKAAGECLVLLKNEKNFLPLSPSAKKIAVIGKFATESRYQGSGSSQINPTKVESILEELKVISPKTEFVYAEGFGFTDNRDEEKIKDAVKAAEEADLAIIVAGLPTIYESEGFDRKHINLPAVQNEVIDAVTKKQKRTVVVLQNGSAVSLPDWLERTPAVLEAWLSGQAVGGAIADVLFGAVNPSGKLCETFPEKLEQTAPFPHFPGEAGRVILNECVFVGYRHFDIKKLNPQFCFGHGLSYTTFEYSNLVLPEKPVSENDSVPVTVTVKNTGKRAGAEVVQFYLSYPENVPVRQPVKVLKGFSKVQLEPGESKTVSIEIPGKDLSYYSEETASWETAEGEYTISAAASSRDIRHSGTLAVKPEKAGKKTFTAFSEIRDFIMDPMGRKAIKLLEETPVGVHIKNIENGVPNPEAEMFVNMPLFKMIALSGGRMTKEIVDLIVAKANGESND